MKASEARLLKLLRISPQFTIPIFQRTYSWTERECRQLWDDIIRTGSDPKLGAHFVGSIVYISGSGPVTNPDAFVVIDGQQRLTTITLLLEALARHIGDSEPVDGFSAAKLRQYYLINQLEKADRRYKLLLTKTDRDTLVALMEQRDWPKDYSMRIRANFEFLESLVRSAGKDLRALCNGIAKLVIVDVALDTNQDNPQLIFESMNSTGRELTQADLIRNYVLMGLDATHQASLYESHWLPMEAAFGQEAYNTQFDGFMRHYLTLKTGEIPNIRAVYEAFKDYTRRL